MLKNFKVPKLPALPANFSREPRIMARAVLGVLLAANLVAAFAVFRPLGGSAEELDAQLVGMRAQVQQRQMSLQKLRVLVKKIEQARTAGDTFLSTYFMDRRTASSSILTELNKNAKESGIRPKGDSFVFEPVEGSETLSMMTIAANYEGTYSDLLQFVNRLDRSPRFLILESLTAMPQQAAGTLGVAIKFNTFVREETPAR
jgi:type IV pilus assembly protein PilO